MIALDTNLLVYAHRTDNEFHSQSRALVESLAAGNEAWAVPWPCAHEFLAIVTNPRIFTMPTPLATALAVVRDLHDGSGAMFLAEGDHYLDRLEVLATAGKVQGGAVHDARVAALCASHGVSELWTADRDFSRFRDVVVRNPLVG